MSLIRYMYNNKFAPFLFNDNELHPLQMLHYKKIANYIRDVNHIRLTICNEFYQKNI